MLGASKRTEKIIFVNMISRSQILIAAMSLFSLKSFGQGLTIPSGETFFISSGTTVSLTSGNTAVSSGGTLTVNGEYQTKGNFTNSGTLNATSGTLTFNGSSAQTVSVNNATVKDVNIGSTASVTLGNTLNIQGGSNHGTLSVANGGTLATGGYLILKSDANGSAVIAEGASTGSYITGNVLVERFIPATRAYRLLSSSVNTSTTIRENWQEDGSSNSGLGTHITGAGGSTNGFDPSGTNNPSLFTYNVTTATGSWSAVTNTNINTLTAGVPYRLMVRGDRTVDLGDNAATASNTILRATGTVGQGDKIFSGLNTNANGFTFIGNPFPSPVDMSAVMASASNVNTSSYTVWDPNISTRGAYVSVNIGNNSNASGSLQDKYLQPGQACFIQTASSGTPAFRINEAHKASASSQTDVFRQLPPFSTLHMTLYQTDSLENKGRALDGVEINFDPNMISEFDARDSRKVINPDENLSIFVGDQFCSIDSRNLPVYEEVIDVRISQMRHKKYSILTKFFSELGITTYLLDRHTKQYHELNASGITRIDFENDGSTTATANQRFALVFEKTNSAYAIKGQGIVLYPNPLGAARLVSLSRKVQTWQLYDMLGKMIMEQSSGPYDQVQLPANLPAGNYTLKVTDGAGVVSNWIVLE